MILVQHIAYTVIDIGLYSSFLYSSVLYSSVLRCTFENNDTDLLGPYQFVTLSFRNRPLWLLVGHFVNYFWVTRVIASDFVTGS